MNGSQSYADEAWTLGDFMHDSCQSTLEKGKRAYIHIRENLDAPWLQRARATVLHRHSMELIWLVMVESDTLRQARRHNIYSNSLEP